jgi:hypothetical protein
MQTNVVGIPVKNYTCKKKMLNLKYEGSYEVENKVRGKQRNLHNTSIMTCQLTCVASVEESFCFQTELRTGYLDASQSLT